MADFDLNSIGELLTNGGISAIGKRLNLKKSDIAQVLSGGIPALLAGMQSNAETGEGEASLAKALEDHSFDEFADIKNFFAEADLKDGKKILGHIFGDSQKEAVAEISKASGVSKGKTSSILSLVAPLLLSSLGSQQQSQQQNSGFSLANLLGGLLGGGQQQSTDLLGGLLGGAAGSDSGSGGILDGLLNLFH